MPAGFIEMFEVSHFRLEEDMAYALSLNNKDNSIVEAKCTMNNVYEVISADERFYALVGDGSYFSMDKLIFEDDRDTFREYISQQNEEESAVVRLLIHNNMYRWVLIRKLSVSVEGENKMFELKLTDVLLENKKFNHYFNNMRKYRAMLDMVDDKIFEYDMETGIFSIFYYNQGRAEMIERDTLDEWQKRMIRSGFVDKDEQKNFEQLCDTIRNGIDQFSYIIESSIMTKSARKDVLKFKGEVLYDGVKKKAVVGFIIELAGRFEQKRTQYEVVSNKDAFTGLLNKQAATDTFTSMLEAVRSNPPANPVYLALFDLDNFKSVNDTYGHYFGDEVLLCFSHMLKAELGERGVSGRAGGDEFMSLLTGFETEQELRNFLTTVRKHIREKLSEKNPDFYFSSSVGVVEFTPDIPDFNTLYKITDAVLYLAKEKGKDRYIIYNKELHKDILNSDNKVNKTRVEGDFVKPMDKINLAATLGARIIQKGREQVIPVLKELMDALHIHGISVYTGEEMKCSYSLGHYSNKPDNAEYIFDEKYQKLFNEYDYNVMNNIVVLKMDFEAAYNQFAQLGICSSLEMLLKKDGRVTGLINFDTFGEHRRKWSQEDINTVYMVIKAIAYVI